MAITEVIMTVLYALAMLAAIVGNIFLIYIVWKKPGVRSLTSFMFVNMAVADLLVALFMMPMSIVVIFTKTRWKISGVAADIICRGHILISNVTLMASILCLIFIAIDRFCSVVYPLKRHIRCFRNVKFVTPLIWVMSIALMAIYPVTFKFHQEGSYCQIYFVLGNQTETFRGIFLYLFAITYLIPLAIIIPLYAKVARKIWFNQAPGIPLANNQQQQQQELTKRKVVRMLIIIVVVFALCWLPAQAIHLFWAITTFHIIIPETVMFLGFWLAHANSAINPWLYIALNSKIRLAFTRIVTIRKSQERPSRDSNKRSATSASPTEAVRDSKL